MAPPAPPPSPPERGGPRADLGPRHDHELHDRPGPGPGPGFGPPPGFGPGRGRGRGGPMGLRGLAAQLGGARLCYGEAVVAEGRTVVPVARVSGGGGGGFGRGTGEDSGGGGGGFVDAAPIGFIDIGPDGARFVAIRDPVGTARAVRTVLAAVGTLAAAGAALRGRRAERAGGLRARLHR